MVFWQVDLFSNKVRYIFDKQLEEAEVLVLNKIDAYTEQDIEALKETLHQSWPDKPIFCISVQENRGLNDWFEYLLSHETTVNSTMPLDYEVYAEGEAELGWLNMVLDLNFAEQINGDAWLESFASLAHLELLKHEITIAHGKLTLTVSDSTEIGAVSFVDNDGEINVRHLLNSPSREEG